MDITWGSTELNLLKSMAASLLFMGLAYGGSTLFRRFWPVEGSTRGLLTSWRWSTDMVKQGIVLGVGIYGTVTFLGALMFWIFPGPEHPIQRLFQAGAVNLTQMVLLFLAVAFVAPVTEECFFRGFLLPAMGHRWGDRMASHLTALLFAAMHLDPYRFLPLYAAGYMLNRGALRARSIVPAVFAHAFWNLTGLILIWISSWGGIR
ncbi:CPBP family intramembrane metalloprotease [Heliobacterium chlorum]|uniref:CPBP family intramembrane metalloprotease n=1 Tax=Heliobacterium chlorum TaxID=2698 RepID=A0ABR7SZP5_HELCL|nr:type II CAAX endopeptidase family protein [Heliobacterium chlorum]MBC9784008.1 CPBP family intramembrane metalloprotease [Heliobacterium chlorum]